MNIMVQYKLKVYPQGSGREVYRIFNICDKDSLEKLCDLIIDSFGCEEMHLYEFCMDGKKYSQNAIEMEECGRVKLKDIGIEKGQKFLLHYDFGADWLFQINVQGLTEVEKYAKPSVEKEKGTLNYY